MAGVPVEVRELIESGPLGHFVTPGHTMHVTVERVGGVGPWARR